MDDKAAAAAALKRLRTRRGLSLSGLARALNDAARQLSQPHPPATASVQRSVARWESARPTVPDERYQLLLGTVYARTAGGQVALGTGSDFAEYLDALGRFGESERRIAELRSAIACAVTDAGCGMLAFLAPWMHAGLAQALKDPSRTEEQVLVGLSAVVSDVNAQVGTLPFVRLQLLLAPVLEACRRLLSGPVPDPLLPGLREVAVSAGTLAGRLAFETRDDAASRALYADATAHAAALADPWRRAGVHMSHALVTLYSRDGLGGARRLADHAVSAACSGSSVRVRARAHALQAEIAAREGLRRQARTALGLARYDVEADARADPSPRSFSLAHLRGFEGVCELYAGDAADAHDRLDRSAAALTAPREQVQRAIVRIDQALARIRLGEPRAAADLLHGSVGLAAPAGARVPAIRLRMARRELRPWRREGWAADLDDHMMDLLGG